MSPSTNVSRRAFLAGAGALSVAGLARAAIGEGPDAAPAPTPTPGDPFDRSHYLLAPGVIPLNTASLGSTSRAVLECTLDAWRALETEPVRMAYAYAAPDTVIAAADRARGIAAGFLGCDADELLVTHSTTNGMNSVAQGMRLGRGDRVLTTDQEHAGGNMCWRYLAQRHDVAIDTIAITPGDQDHAAIVQRFADAITPATRVISVSHVITTTGLRMPIPAISALARRHGILCVVDGAQAAGNIAVDVRALGCHAYATSGHKWLMGPKGTGLLYVSRDAGDSIAPIQWEDARRYGAESAGVGPMPLAIGLGAAIEALQVRGMAAVERHNLALRNRAYAGLQAIAGLTLLSPPPGPFATAMVACALPDRIDSRALRMALFDKHRIVVKMLEKHWSNGIRLSPHMINTEADIDAALEAIRAELG